MNIDIILGADVVMEGNNNKREFLAEDGVHYNEKGDMAIGNYLADWFNLGGFKN